MGNYKNRKDMLDDHGVPHRTSLTVDYLEQNSALVKHSDSESLQLPRKEIRLTTYRRLNYCLTTLLILALLAFLCVVYYYHYHPANNTSPGWHETTRHALKDRPTTTPVMKGSNDLGE
ncbi:hypothetical protein QR680_008326 [Steinernema hermaphroditum]|uniref:Uncharacterized protein n=1 Tax=Steinernema hermaphroditum TaxID=289476 RepID=A0AA39IID8_9BILA|nr:hypothetical protein QR680_008326 [Steinernema hermaphroditum]